MPKRREVRYGPGALDDLNGLFDYLSDNAGVGVAERYIDRIHDYVGSFGLFAERGARRDDLRPGVRLIGFERRVTILFEVTDETVIIIAVLYGGQDVEGRFAEDQP